MGQQCGADLRVRGQEADPTAVDPSAPAAQTIAELFVRFITSRLIFMINGDW